MTKREKIIVGVMCLTILYGAYELFWAGQGARSQISVNSQATQDVQSFAAEMSRKLVDDRVSPELTYLIDLAESAWTKDPFIQTTAPLSAENKVASVPDETTPRQPAVAPDFTYSGYLKLGDKALAVINGLEYVRGESLGMDGFYVKQISPQYVVIGRVGDPATFQLPLREEGPGM